MKPRTRSPHAPDISDKVTALSRPGVLGPAIGPVTRRETHMSWVFFADDLVFKLKKPVRFSYLDFSTLARRETACRAEVALNRPLAPDVYLGVTPVTASPGGLTVAGDGEVVDWLVIMRRLDERLTLQSRLADTAPSRAELERLADVLARFYRHARRRPIAPAQHRLAWRRALDLDRRVLLNPALGLPAAQVRRIDCVLRRFLVVGRTWLDARVAAGRVVDAHGDLRPEHIWLGDPVKVIDRLEFSAALRAVDPVDELADLEVACERLGAPGVGLRIREAVQARLSDPAPEALALFYRCHRSMLRARLAIAHLLEPDPRTPDKWPRQARACLAIAGRDARRLDLLLSRPAGR